jgi:hypothetical protein
LVAGKHTESAMGATYRFLATVEEGPTVLSWFGSLPEQPVESGRNAGAVFYFPNFGPLGSDPRQSPLVSLFLPARRRGALTTVGEVHFLTTPLSQFPGLNRVSERFHTWLSQHPCVFSRRSPISEWDYFLEGSTRNSDSDIFALPGGLEALKSGAYFIAHGDSASVVDRVCRQLELRGIAGILPAESGDHRGT